MSIGETLADARRQAGLTVTQVADRTRIRETIIRGIEQDDFSACGGDFYTRGHIRSIASVVGIDPVPLIREYDEAHGAPEAMRAADVFEPSTPLRIKERRSLNWSVAMILALLVIVGYGAYHLVSSSSSHGKTTAAALPAASRSATPRPNSPSPTPTRTAPSNDVIIQLTAVEDCWVFLTSDQGNNTIYSGVVPAGSTQTWKETKAVSLRLGNPAGVVLTVNGKKQSPGTSQPVTLTLGPGQEVSAQPGPGNAS
ncbi:MAG: helix-turn-helix domain-containing protein [Streptosporangiaceae bacterium]